MSNILKAYDFAKKKHEGQFRKGTSIPYIVHPYEVYKLAKEFTDDENILIAALLHDTIEDTDTTKDEIALLFNEEVANMVDNLSIKWCDSWKEEKIRYINSIANSNDKVKFIKACDLCCNLSDMHNDYLKIQNKVWEKFNADYKTLKWYYNSIAKAVSSLTNYRYILDRIDNYLKFLFWIN